MRGGCPVGLDGVAAGFRPPLASASRRRPAQGQGAGGGRGRFESSSDLFHKSVLTSGLFYKEEGRRRGAGWGDWLHLWKGMGEEGRDERGTEG